MELTHAIIRKDYVYSLVDGDRVVKRLTNTSLMDKYYSLEDAVHDMGIRMWSDDDTTKYVVVEIEDETEKEDE